MKKKTLIIIAVVVLVLAAVAAWYMRPLSPSDEASIAHEGLEVSVSYSRPYKKGRIIFDDANTGALQPYGQYWRLGANAATEITFSRDVTFGGKPVRKGTYRMYAVPGKESWQITLNSALGKSGSELPDPNLDVVSVEVIPAQNTTETEQFIIELKPAPSGVIMELKWDRVVVPVGIS